MKVNILSPEQVLSAYDTVCSLYPFVPPLSLWRSWEYAAYRKYSLRGRVLDVGCGDGRYFHLLWPHVRDAVGIDLDTSSVETAKGSGIYTEVFVTAAQNLPFKAESFDALFANCSLEHMDHLDLVLSDMFRCLRPDGLMLCSVVTDKFVKWSVLPRLLKGIGYFEAAEKIQKEWESYHHLVNPLTVDQWNCHFVEAGFVTEELVPIVPKLSNGLFLLMDGVWHLKKKTGGELGDNIYSFLATNDKFTKSFRMIMAAILEMESNPVESGGAVFLLHKRRPSS